MLDINYFDRIRIGLASPEQIRAWSSGEVKKPETINYRTLKPEREGLFCEKIFGPTRDWECHCGKYKRVRYKGIVCDRCGVEVTRAKVRRERMGHIELAAPVSHIWFFKGIPSRMGLILDMSPRTLEKVLYFASYIVIDPGDPAVTGLTKQQLLSEAEYREYRDKYGSAFEAGIGAEAIKKLLQELDLDELSAELRREIAQSSGQRRVRAVRRLEVVEAFRASGNDPAWMILDVIPVIPPELRPMVQLDGGRFATSDLNDLYRRVINRNNRLKRLLELGAPDIIVRNEKRMLQEAVDALIDNGRRGRPVTGPGNRPLKSLSDMLKGKQGRFRQNLLGKRVDYSGRSVIVVGPKLRIHQCGLPKEMALELFKPFVMKELVEKGIAHNIKSAKKMVDRVRPEVWDIVEEVIKEHPVLLNRAPTLHRLGIQAFEPVLVEGRAIQLHPLVCSAYNADFDGDQMAVHVPLSAEAQVEARMLMLGSRNILKPASGEPVVTPSHDMVIGVYYLTKPMAGVKGEGMVFADKDEVIGALDAGKVDYHAKIKIRGVNRINETGNDGEPRKPAYWKDYTTPGQVIFNGIVPQGMGYIMANGQIPHEKAFGKKGLSAMVSRCHQEQGAVACAVFLDNLKDLGFHYSTVSGLTVGMGDMMIPETKAKIVADGRKQVADVEERTSRGELTEAERYNRIIDIWSKATDDVRKSMMEVLERDRSGFNPIFMMTHSGARGSIDQVRQLAGMRGLMSKPKKKLSGELGETIETPIVSSLKEGLSVIEYSISTHGSRKGLADTALKTADAGYLTRRLVDVCQDVVITVDDCGTIRGRNISALKDGEEILEPLRDRIVGKVTAEDVFDPVNDEIILEAGQEITADVAARIEEKGIETLRIRSVLTCEVEHGLCARCYGWDLSRNRMVTQGEAVGVIAAQSIGEPGTQLTLRTFHTGGVAGREAKETEVRARRAGKVSFRNIHIVEGSDESGNVNRIVTRNGQVLILDERGEAVSTYDIAPGSIITVTEDQHVERDDLICRSDPFIIPIVSEHDGSAHYVDIEEEITLREEIDSEQRRQMVIVEDRSRTLHPHLFILPEQVVVLSGRAQRRDRELRTLSDLLNETESTGGRMVFTYRDLGSVRNTSLLEDFIMDKDLRIPHVGVDCRRAQTGSYATFMDLVNAIEPLAGKGAAKLWKKLRAAADSLSEAGARSGEELEQEFIDCLLAFSVKVPLVLSIAELNRGHAGTRKLVSMLCRSINHGKMLMIASFSRRGLRSHSAIRSKQRQQDQDPVEEFIKDNVLGVYPIPSGAHLRVEDGALVRKGVHLARIERRLGQQRDITGGLPRVEELVEARCPLDAAAIAEISGVVSLSPISMAAMRTITIRGDQGQESSIKIPASKHIRVREGDHVEAGDKLTEGPLDPHDILRVRGTESVEEYLLNEIQEVYRLQGVKINDKHVGIVVRQMLSKAKVEDPGDTRFLEGAQVDRLELNRHNMEVMRQGKRPATSDVLLLGITKASLATDSFLSAASFQETNTVLADAAVQAKVDPLIGLKENVIVGHLIPAGTGLKIYRNTKLFLPDGSEPPEPVKLEREEDTLDMIQFDS